MTSNKLNAQMHSMPEGPSYRLAALFTAFLLLFAVRGTLALPATQTITTSGGYTIHTFTGAGINTQSTLANAEGTLTLGSAVTADVIIVAGGGGGGHQHAGGGGAGGLIQISNLSLGPGSYPITVGGGGAGCSWYPFTGIDGGNSSAFGSTALGGGAGTGMNQYGNSGGSGGGDGYPSGGVQGGSGTPGQGNNGSRGSSTSQLNGGGGGGAGGPGIGANGGAALSTWAGTFAGGGGGGFAGGPGGGGGAGAGGLGSARGAAAAPNTGSGGGGGGNYDAYGGNGGSGIVIVRYPTPPVVRSVNISLPSGPVYAGQTVSVTTSASTSATDAEQIGFYHLEYSVNGGGTWNAVAYDVNVGKSATRNFTLTAPPAGSNGTDLIRVRVRIAFRGGAAGDVDYQGGAINWSGSWDSWQSPPAKLAKLSVSNSAPTASWTALPSSPLQSGTYFVARATGADVDGNLSTIFVDSRVNGGAWTPFAYNGAGANGGNGFSTTSDNNGFTAGPGGTTYQFRAQATDGSGATSPWIYSSVYTTGVLLGPAAQGGLYHLRAQATKSGNPSNPQDFGGGVLFEVYKRSSSGDTRLWSTVFARPNSARLDFLVDLAQNDFVYWKSTPLSSASSYDTVTVTVDAAATHLANLGLATFSNGVPTVVAKTSSTAVSSLAADGNGSYTASLQALINEARNWVSTYDRVEIVLPQGDYPLGTDGAAGGDTLLAIFDTRNITLRGAGTGARLISRTSKRMYLDVQFSASVRVENVTFDTVQSELPFIQGQVSDVGTDWIRVALDWTPSDQSRFTTLKDANGNNLVAAQGYLAANPALNNADSYFNPSAVVFEANNLVKLTINGTHHFVPGDKVVLKVNDSISESATRFNYTTDSEIVNVRINAGPRLAMICRGTNGMHFNGFQIDKVPTIGGAIPRLLSTNGDGIHYQGGRRGPTVESSTFKGMGDDGINIYASIVDITSVSGSTFTVPSAGDLMVGDVLLVYRWINNETRPTSLSHVRVTSLTDNGGSWTVGVTGVLNPDTQQVETLPADANRYVNVSASGEGFIIRNSTFGPNRGMGNRIQSGFGLITGNTFQDTSSIGLALDSVIVRAGAGDFREGPYPRDLVVQQNTFNHTGYQAGDLAVRVWAERFYDAPVPAPMFKNVVSQIKQNVFTNQTKTVELVGGPSLYPGTYNP